jgi:hypothetical protein
MSNPTSEIWKDRFSGLQLAMNALVQSYESSKFEGDTEFINMLRYLKNFAEKHFNYFYDGFFGPNQYLQHSNDFPPAYVMRAVLDRIATDLSIIQLAVAQRRLNTSAETDTSAETKKLIQLANGLAMQALQLVKDVNIADIQAKAIIYFQKIAEVRVVPYANTAFVAIPLSALTADRDFLAIPHEVGHYLYWYGMGDDGRPVRQYITTALGEIDSEALSEIDLDDRPWIENWAEEIFADVFGCLIGGPAIALDFQDLSLERLGQEFTKDDGEHPVPFLRPYIYTKVLKIAGFDNASRRLRKQWEDSLRSFGKNEPTEFTPYGAGSKNSKTKQQALEELDRVIGIILPDKQQLPIVKGLLNQVNTTGSWSEDLNDNQPIKVLYDKLNREKLMQIAAQAITPSTINEVTWDSWFEYRFEYHGLEVKDGFIQEKGSKSKEGTTKGWGDVLFADGWTTEGPHSQDR